MCVNVFYSLLTGKITYVWLFSLDWERMSCVWSTFGMIGALRAHLKVAVGLASSERACVSLIGAGGYTSQKTERALCYWRVGRPNTSIAWRDPAGQMLSLMRSSSSAWMRPHFIIIGYSQCPWDWRRWRCIKEILVPCLWALFSIAITSLPTLTLFPSIRRFKAIERITLSLQVATSVFAGTIVPILIHRFNSPGVPHLRQIDVDRLNPNAAGIVRQGDHIMAAFTKNETHIVWQTPETEAEQHSGDLWWIRLLCTLNSSIILAAYLFNYICLGTASSQREYLWLGSQTLILACRYVLWAKRLVLFPQHPPCLLYIAAGSLSTPLSVDPPPNRLPPSAEPKLQLSVINFAVTSAYSKVTNQGIPSIRLRPEFLVKLANTIPLDIISSEYVLLAGFFSATNAIKITIVRLSWNFVEEVYAAQGVILGHNPWALGGLYLGAVLLDDKFIGLTTVHPFQAHVAECADKRCAASHATHASGGMTLDSFFVDSLIGGCITKQFCDTNQNLLVWHDKFRSNVALCRSTARSNGPSYIEIHSSTFGPFPQHRRDISRVEPTLSLDFVGTAVLEARTKKHDQCDPSVCEIETFAATEIRIPPC